jgi:hypothetical protein
MLGSVVQKVQIYRKLFTAGTPIFFLAKAQISNPRFIISHKRNQFCLQQKQNFHAVFKLSSDRNHNREMCFFFAKGLDMNLSRQLVFSGVKYVGIKKLFAAKLIA